MGGCAGVGLRICGCVGVWVCLFRGHPFHFGSKETQGKPPFRAIKSKPVFAAPIDGKWTVAFSLHYPAF